MVWSIVDVARMSGVTSRTLRHYDAIGLLPPAYIGDNGYRYYDTDQLLRLQQILLLRELRVQLAQIAQVLDGAEDLLSALRRHRDALAAERGRLAHLEHTVEDTIARLEGTHPVYPERLFDGFRANPDQVADAEDWLVQRFGEQAREFIHQGQQRKHDWSEEQTRQYSDEGNAILERLAQLHQAGVSLDDERLLDAVEQHYRWIRQSWDATPEAYIGLGQYYVEYASVRQVFEARSPGLADYLRQALAHYARTRLR